MNAFSQEATSGPVMCALRPSPPFGRGHDNRCVAGLPGRFDDRPLQADSGDPRDLFRLVAPVLISFFCVRDKIAAAIMASIIQVNAFVFGVALGAVTVELFPREKIGQFCSAQAFSPFIDWLKFNRAGYLWSAFFYLLAGLTV